MSRYLVIEVACLECSYGDADAHVVTRTDSLEQAVADATKEKYSSEFDMFVVDMLTGNITSPNAASSD